jgi:hypothetical protein
MLHEITRAVPDPHHTLMVTWSDGARAEVSLGPFLVDFSADGLRQDAFPAEAKGEALPA